MAGSRGVSLPFTSSTWMHTRKVRGNRDCGVSCLKRHSLGCRRMGCHSECSRMAWQSCIALYLSQPQKLRNVHSHTPAQTLWEQIQNWPSAEVMPNHTIGRVHWEGDTETALESSIFSTEEIHSFGTPDFYYLPWSTLFPIRCDIKSLK